MQEKSLTRIPICVAQYPDSDTRSEAYLGMMEVYSARRDRENWDRTRRYILDNFPNSSAAMSMQFMRY